MREVRWQVWCCAGYWPREQEGADSFAGRGVGQSKAGGWLDYGNCQVSKYLHDCWLYSQFWCVTCPLFHTTFHVVAHCDAFLNNQKKVNHVPITLLCCGENCTPFRIFFSGSEWLKNPVKFRSNLNCSTGTLFFFSPKMEVLSSNGKFLWVFFWEIKQRSKVKGHSTPVFGVETSWAGSTGWFEIIWVQFKILITLRMVWRVEQRHLTKAKGCWSFFLQKGNRRIKCPLSTGQLHS